MADREEGKIARVVSIHGGEGKFYRVALGDDRRNKLGDFKSAFSAHEVAETINAAVSRLLGMSGEREAALLSRVERLEKALTRLRDCDWVISLQDRMDAVRDIARNALNNS